MTGLLRDLHFALRQLRTRPAFTAIAVLVLAVGLGATAAIFSVVNAVLLKRLPYPNPHTLVGVFESDVIGNGPEDRYNVASPGLFDEWREHARSLSSISAVQQASFNISSKSQSFAPEHIVGLACSSTFTDILGVQPILGRFFNGSEDQYEAPRVAVLSYGFWIHHFGGARNVPGREIRLDGENYTILGVLPKYFVYPGQPADVFVPFRRTIELKNRGNFSNHYFNIVGRLAPGYSVASAQQELTSIVKSIRASHPSDVMGTFATVVEFNKYLVHDVRTGLLVLMSAVGCLLLIACVNIANLLLTRTLGRQRELAIRFALGANRFRIVRQLLIESILVSFVGAAGGLLVAAWVSAFLASHAPGARDLPQVAGIHMDAAVLFFTAGMALLSGIGAGLVPALSASRAQLGAGMKETSRSATASRSQTFLRQVLVGLEVGVSLILLIAAGLLLRSFLNLENVSPGFRASNSVSFEVSLPDAVYKNRQAVSNFERRLGAELRNMPGVASVGLTDFPPLAGHWSDSVFHIKGHPLPPRAMMDLVYREADPQYFTALGIPLLRGRLFTETDGIGYDDKHPLLGKAIINEAAARKFFKGLDPIGQVLEYGTDAGLAPDPSGNPYPEFQIIGVVGDVPTDAETGIEATFYQPLLDGESNTFYAIVHTEADPIALSASMKRVLRRLDPDLPMENFRTFAQINAQVTSDRRFSATLLFLFAAAALVLAAIGLYGVVSYNVSQRTAEIGIRMALGARRAEVSRIVLIDGMKPAAAGLLTGLAASFALMQLLKSMLFQVSAFDLVTFVAVPAILIATVVLACLAPALRAASIDPTIALRVE
ncbi:MAG: ABC transporter permease [Acidobacteriaceae bacterium]|nr:ABC transporter permease [Acidobacteriaceae bacterium]